MKYLSLLLFIAFFLFESGCARVKRMQNEIIKQKTTVHIDGDVVIDKHIKHPIMIVLMQDRGSYPELIDYRIKNGSGSFSFRVEPGKYKIYAWLDKNNNKKFDRDEPIDTAVMWAYIYGMKKHPHLHIQNLASTELLEEIGYVRKKQVINIDKSHMLLGSVVSLDNAMFSEANVSRGMSEPYSFAQSVPHGLFFLQKYQPNKKVVLFVHGINGSPRNFSEIIKNLDKSRYQPLVYYYPSGLNLDMVSQNLLSSMEELRLKLGFKKVSLIAHSMGGLVSRAYINRLSTRGEHYIDSFITISTPWDGHESAGYGVKYSPIIIPVWDDMAPKSRFLEQLFVKKLPQSTPFYLLFGYSGISVTAGGNSDGVVSIRSQLRYEAQEEAAVMRGFDEGHMSILENTQAIELINKFLEQKL